VSPIDGPASGTTVCLQFNRCAAIVDWGPNATRAAARGTTSASLPPGRRYRLQAHRSPTFVGLDVGSIRRA